MILNDELRQKLIEAAIQARGWAYAPYSKYTVGSALLTRSGKIYEGVNVENAAYPLCICAERVAVFKAVSEGEREFTAIAVATVNGGSPCGSCRQVLYEFSPETVVLLVDEHGKVTAETNVTQLLPGGFGPANLRPIE